MEMTQTNMKNTKLWTKDFIITTLTTFFIFLTFYLLMTTLSMYAIEQFRASQTEAGFAASIFVIGSLIFRLFAGKYIDIIGRKILLYSSLTLFLVSCLLYFTVDSYALLLIVRFIHGAAFGIATTVTSTAVIGIIPPTRRGEGTGYFSLSSPLATAIGPFLGILIMQKADYDMIFIVCTALSVISIVVMLFATVAESPLTAEQRKQAQGFRLQDFFEKTAIPIAIIIFIMGIVYASVLTYMSPYAVEVNLTSAASIFFVVYAIFLLASRPFTGKIFDRKGANIVIYPALFLFAVGMVCLSLSFTNTMLLIAGALIALGFGNMVSCSQAVVVSNSPRHRIGLANSTFYIAMDAGIGVGPIIVGLILPFVGFRGMYMTMAAIVLVTIVLYYFLHGRNARVPA